MKQSKFWKALMALGMGAMMTASAFGMVACDPDTGNSGNEDDNGDGHKHEYVYVSDGESGHHEECKEHDDSKPKEAHVYDNDQDPTCNKCDYVRKIDGGHEEKPADNAILPEYTGPAAGPTAGSNDIVYELNAANLATGTLSEAWTDGTFTVVSGEVRGRTPTGENAEKYSRSIKNGVVTVTVPSAGKLSFAFSNGSTTKSSYYKITALGVAQDSVEVSTGDKVLNVITLDVTAGEYKFETASGTIDLYGVELAINGVEAKPIQSIEIASAGTTAYLITQKVDCTGVKIVAKDGNGITHDVSLANCKFDTSDYKPNQSGEYTIGVTYYLSDNLGSETLEFKASYTVKIYAVDSISLVLYGLSSNKQVTVQQAYLTTDTYAKDSNLAVMAVCDYNGDKIDYKLKSDWYTVTESLNLGTAGTYTVDVNVNTAYTVGNKEVKASYDIISAAKKNVEEDNTVKVTVGAHGEFKTVTQAIQYLKKCAYAENVIKIVEIEEGTYAEKIWIDVANVTLIGKGENKDATVITCSLVEGDVDNLSGAAWALNCATVHVTGANFKAYNLSIRNDFDYIKNSGNYSGNQAAQGVALTLDADGAVLYDCHLYGNQDTLYMKSGRSYYYKSQIDGNIDFIFGGDTGLAYFEECKIVAVSRTSGEQNGYVTAAKHEKAKKPNYGYIFYKCELTDDGKVADGAMSLGRPWGAAATVAYIECSFSKAYSTVAYGTANAKTTRWSSMSGAEPANADFCEYGSTGDGAISTAVAGGKVLTADQAANYTKANIFGTSNGNVGYTAAFDCDAALATLKIVAGLEEGEVPQDPTVTVNLKDESIPDGNCGEYINTTYADILTWEGTCWIQASKPENGIKINTDTVIKIKIAGEVSLVQGYELPATDYVITYTDGKATITFVAATGTYGTFIGGIVIDTSKTVPDTEYVQVTYDYNDGATENNVVTVIKGSKLTPPADPVRSGYTFEYWYTGEDDSVEYNFDTVVNAALTLKAKWSAGEVATEYTVGAVIDMAQLTKTYQAGTDTVTGLELGVFLNATSGKIQPNNGNVFFYGGATIKVKVAEGLTVLPVWHNATPKDGFSVSARDSEGYVTITALEDKQNYIMKIMVISAYSAEEGGTLTCGQDGMAASFQGHYASNGIIEIDATATGAKFDGKPDNNYAQFNKDTVIRVKAPAGVTSAEGVTVTVTAYNKTDITEKYTIGYENGYITITGTSNSNPDCYPSTFVISFAA